MVPGHAETSCDAGPGQQVAFVHGVGSDSRSWARVAERLGPARHVTTVDLPGISMLRLDEPTQSVTDHALAVDAQMVGLGVDKYSLVGHSFGAVVAIITALAFPTHVESLSLIAPGGFGPEINPALRLMSSRTGLGLLRLVHRPRVRRRVEGLATRYRRGDRDAGSIDELLDTYHRLADRDAQRKFQESVAAVFQTRRAYRDVPVRAPEMPVQILWGSNDLILPAWQSEAAATALKTRNVHIIDGAGHSPHRTHAAEVTRLLQVFWSAGAADPTHPRSPVAGDPT